MSDCADEHRTWFPQRTVCYATMTRAAAQAMYAEMHEKQPYHDGTFQRWSDKRDVRFPYHFNDGVTVWVSDNDLTPHDHFLGGKKDCADCAVEKWSEGQESD